MQALPAQGPNSQVICKQSRPNYGVAYWISLLKDLGISHSRVGHMALDSTSTIPCWSCTAPTSNCLIVAERLVSEREVVHASDTTDVTTSTKEYLVV